MACFPFCNLLGHVASFKGGKNPEWPGEPTQPPIQWVPGALSLEVKRPRYEADHSLPSSAEVKE